MKEISDNLENLAFQHLSVPVWDGLR
jgi:hypothetical protein